MDWQREQRTGVPEAVFCEHKDIRQIEAIIGEAQAARKRLLLTRLAGPVLEGLSPSSRGVLDYDQVSRTAILGNALPAVASGIGIIAAGTSDAAVALEAARTLAFAGHSPDLIVDVGVAGLWRLTGKLDRIRSFRLIIAVAGMEGALFSVLAGLVTAPVIAVPTSVGYGVARGGTVALNAALASCAPGVVVVNIDNGYGAAAAAIKILGLGQPTTAA
jgi:NCAIR mutase (PurE)-related protein